MTETIVKNVLLSKSIAELTDEELQVEKNKLRDNKNNTFLLRKPCDEWCRDLTEYHKNHRSRKTRLKNFLFAEGINAMKYQRFIKKYEILVDKRIIKTLDFIINKLEKYPQAIVHLFKSYTEHPFFKEYNRNEDYFKLKYLLYSEVLLNNFNEGGRK